MITPRPKRWSITTGGTFPRRKPGMLTDLATSAYALSMLGLRSANGTSTVILTRVELNCSTVLGTLFTPVMVAPDGIRKPSRMAHAEPRQSYGASSGRPNLRGLNGATGLVGQLVCPTLIRERSAKVGRPGRSVAASASALGAEDRRFESCRPDTVIQSTALAPEDHHGNAGVAQWQSPSLPSWPCEFDSRHPL